MKNKGQKNERTTRLKSMILLVAFTAIMLIVSTYAWFTTQRAVTLSNLSGDVKVAEGLEVSLDAKSWAYSIDLSQVTLNAVTTDDTLGSYSATANHVPTELKPVSTIGAVGGSKIKFWNGVLDGSNNSLSSIAEVDEATAGYYAFDIFLRDETNGDSAQPLSLSSGSSVVVKASGGDATTGLQNTVRLALAKFTNTADIGDQQDAIIQKTVTTANTISQVSIWEPNSNYHVPYMVQNTARFGDKITAVTQDPITTYALNDAEAEAVSNVYATTGENKLSQQVTLTTNATVTGEGESQTVDYATAEDVSITDVSSQSFTIAANKVTRLRVYVWLEGQDHDCVNYASHGGGITVSFGLEK